MGNTSHYQIPYPELNMAPDGPSQMRGLAEKVDSSIWDEVSGLKTADTSINSSLTALTGRMTTAESSIATINSKIADTGTITMPVSYSSGWAAGSGTNVIRKFGPVAMMAVYAKRTGSAITAGSNGNINDTPILTITTAAHQPMSTMYVLVHNQTGTGSPWEGWLSASGLWQVIASTRAGAVISTNDELRGTYIYLA